MRRKEQSFLLTAFTARTYSGMSYIPWYVRTYYDIRTYNIKCASYSTTLRTSIVVLLHTVWFYFDCIVFVHPLLRAF